MKVNFNYSFDENVFVCSKMQQTGQWVYYVGQIFEAKICKSGDTAYTVQAQDGTVKVALENDIFPSYEEAGEEAARRNSIEIRLNNKIKAIQQEYVEEMRGLPKAASENVIQLDNYTKSLI